MVRRVLSLLQRMILSLALIVAALPLKASEPAACAAPPPQRAEERRASCAMPCCAAKPMAEPMTCGPHSSVAPSRNGARAQNEARSNQRGELASAKDPCRCELKSAPSQPAQAPQVAVSGFDQHAFVAILPSAFPEIRVPLEIAEPGIYGIDSGPPAGPEHSSDSGRAPPVAYA